jgi:hypothetical protein
LNSLPQTPTPKPDCDLTSEQAQRLAELEPIIERGLSKFVEVGKALLEFSDQRLYRQTHPTFKDYVEDKWKISVSRAYRMCEAAEAVKMLPIGQQPEVKNERQARELAKAQPEMRAKVLEQAAASGRVTTESIRKSVHLLKLPPASSSAGCAPDCASKERPKDQASEEDRPHVVARVEAMSNAQAHDCTEADGAGERRFHPRLNTKKKLLNWWLRATPRERGDFLSYVFTKPVTVKDKNYLRDRFEQWFALEVKEQPSGGNVTRCVA